MDALPPLPGLSGDIILEVFTHKSLRFTGAPTASGDEYENNRLAVIGQKASEMAITDALFRQRPVLQAAEIKVSQSLLENTHMARTTPNPDVSVVRAYRWDISILIYEYWI